MLSFSLWQLIFFQLNRRFLGLWFMDLHANWRIIESNYRHWCEYIFFGKQVFLRGDFILYPGKSWNTLKGVHNAKARVNEIHNGDVLLLKDHINPISADLLLLWIAFTIATVYQWPKILIFPAPWCSLSYTGCLKVHMCDSVYWCDS